MSITRRDGFRSLPDDVRRGYLADGAWDDVTLAALLLAGLRRQRHQRIRLWSNYVRRDETFESLDAASRRFATGLMKHGVSQGDPVVIWLPNGWEALVAFVGAAVAGAAVVPIAAFYGRKELIDAVNSAGASTVITCAEHGRRDYLAEVMDCRADMPALRTVVACGAGIRPRSTAGLVTFDEMVSGTPSDPIECATDQPSLLAFTSGTSGTAKGVVHTHRTLGAEVRRHLTSMIPSDATPQIMASPVAHAAGMTLGLLAPIYRGEPIHLIDAFDIDFVLDTASREGLAPGGGASVFLSALIDHPSFTDELAARMGYVILGGSTIPEALVAKAASRGVSVLRSYGLTEHPTVSAASLTDDPQLRERTDGRLLDGVEVQVRDSSGSVLQPGGEGEIFTRGPDMCAGYLQPELNAAFDGDGWLATGDLGVLDADGYLAITARAKDLIIRNGVNISPTEVENALLSCTEIAEVAVIGVPDDRTGERAVAVVVAPPGSEPTLSTLTAHLAALGVAKAKWPEGIHLVGTLPRTASGKVRKNDLRRDLT